MARVICKGTSEEHVKQKKDDVPKVNSTPGGGGTAICGLCWYVPLSRVWFSSSLLWNRVYKSEESLILE